VDRLTRKPQVFGNRRNRLPAPNQTDRLLLVLKRVSRPNRSRHAEPSKTDYNQSAWGDVFRGQGQFSDYKTRGFNLEDSQIERTDRLDRLVLVLSLALYWAVSTGMWDAMENKTPAEKKTHRRNAKTSRVA
jgi:hypothetical protein